MSLHRLKVGIVGCGGIAGRYDETSHDKGIYSHAGAYRSRASEIAFEACVEPDPIRRQEFQKYWEVPYGYGTLSELLGRHTFDILSVCSPDARHAEQLMEILQSRKARMIWAEKPLTIDFERAMRIVDQAKAMGTGIRLTNQRRWEPVHCALAKELRNGVIGNITAVTGYYVKGLTHIGTTMINTLRFLVGDIAQVEAVGSTKGSYPGDPSRDAVVWFDGDVAGMIHGVDGASYSYSLFEIDVVGTKGRVRILNNGDVIEIGHPVPYGHYDGFAELQLKERRQSSLANTMVYGLDSMVEAFRCGTASDVSEAEEGLRELGVVRAILESAQRGGARGHVAAV